MEARKASTIESDTWAWGWVGRPHTEGEEAEEDPVAEAIPVEAGTCRRRRVRRVHRVQAERTTRPDTDLSIHTLTGTPWPVPLLIIPILIPRGRSSPPQVPTASCCAWSCLLRTSCRHTCAGIRAGPVPTRS